MIKESKGELDLSSAQTPENEEIHGITKFDLEEGQVSQDVHAEPTPDCLKAFKDETPQQLLNRVFEIDKADYSGSLLTINPIVRLTEIPYINSILEKWRYFRADVRVKILLRAIPQQYGAVQVSWLPYVTSIDSNNIYNSREARSQANSKLLDISSQDSCEFVIPYISPNLFMDRFESEYARINSLFIEGLNTFRTTLAGGTTNIALRVYANFENVTLAGPISSDLPPIVAQMNREERAIVGRGNNGQGLNGAGMLVLGSAAVNAAGTLVNMGRSVLSNYNKMHADVQSVKKLVKQEEPSGKESNNEPEPFRPSAFGDLATMARPSTSGSMAMNPNSMKLDPSWLGDNTVEHEICDMCRLPTLVYVDDGSVSFFAGVTTDGSDYLTYFQRFFRLWRGSLKYKIAFVTSPLIAARYIIRLDYDSTAPILETPDNVYSKIVSVRGTTHVEFEVPYIYARPWARNSDNAPRITITAIDPPVTAGDATPFVTILVYKAAGEDFQFTSLRDWNGDLFPFENIEAQCDIKGDFSSKFESISLDNNMCGYPAQCETTTVEALLSRFSSRFDHIASVSNQILQSNDMSQLSNFDRLCYLFRFYRGSMRFKVAYPIAAGSDLPTGFALENGQNSVSGLEDKIPNGTVQTIPSVFPVLDLDIPFYCEADATSCYLDLNAAPLSLPFQTEAVGQIQNVQDVYVCKGPNFQLFYVMPVPRRLSWHPP